MAMTACAFGERTHLLSIDRECADQPTLSKQRRDQEGSGAAIFHKCNKWCKAPPVRRLGPGIQNVNFLFCLCEASQWIFWYRLYQRGSLSFLMMTAAFSSNLM